MSSMTVKLPLSLEEGYTLLTCMNYLFSSIQDLEAIENEQEKKDAELEWFRCIAEMQAIDDTSMIALVDKLEVLRLELIKKGEHKAGEISVLEYVPEPASPTTT